MNQFTIDPYVYATGPAAGLVSLLEEAWVRNVSPGHGTMYIVSGFSNYNGGVRFYDLFENHISRGGRVVAYLGGSTSARLSSVQVVEELLRRGADVCLVSRKRPLHAKCYGTETGDGDQLLVTSGNFTGPGMSQNVEGSVLLDSPTTSAMGFNWSDLVAALGTQGWDTYQPSLARRKDPAWTLLYDEVVTPPVIDDSVQQSLVVTLGHADTVRINAQKGTPAAKGSQYIWLSKDSFGFFPPLTIRNEKGVKPTYSCMIDVLFVDLQATRPVRVTFEAGNNVDFRLGTGPLRGTKLADVDDLAVLTRRAEESYELKIVRRGTTVYRSLRPYAVNDVGHQRKRYGYAPNDVIDSLLHRRRAGQRRSRARRK